MLVAWVFGHTERRLLLLGALSYYWVPPMGHSFLLEQDVVINALDTPLGGWTEGFMPWGGF